MRRLLWLFSLGLLTLLTGCSSGDHPVIVMDTSMGTIKIELDEGNAPITVKNFLKYVEAKHYDNTVFHRVIKDFMIQGGNYSTDFKQKLSGDPIKNESYNGLSNQRGTIAMARTSEPNSATDQFYINVADNASKLDRKSGTGNEGYCVFGKVIEGMDVVDKIQAVPTHSVLATEGGKVGRVDDVPVEPVILKSVRRVDVK